MTPEEKIKRLEFLIRLLVEYIETLEKGEPSGSIYRVIDAYCDIHEIPNPLMV